MFLLLVVVLGWSYPKAAFAQATPSFSPLQRTIKVLSTKLNGFGIPFKVDARDGQFIEVQLYQSRDQGKTWSFHSRQPTTAREFPFTAEGDGEYWFSIKTLDRNRRLLPEGDPIAELKIVVDTIEPKLGFQIESDPAGRVVCRWQASDKNLNTGSFQIHYRASAGELVSGEAIDDRWRSVPIELNAVARNGAWSDQVAWWPDTADERLEVRVRISDNAGNFSSVTREVAVQKTSWRRRTTGTTLGKANPYYSPAAQKQNNAPQNPIAQNARMNSDSSGGSQWQPVLKPFIDGPTNTNGSDATPSLAQTSQPPTNQRWRVNNGLGGATDSQRFQRPQMQSPQTQRQATQSLAVQGVTTPSPSTQLASYPVDFVDPPEPIGWNSDSLAAPSQMPPAANATEDSQHSIPWNSTVETKEQLDRAFVGSTLEPSPDVLPLNRPPSPRLTDAIEPNPATMVRNGEQMIGESTTSWPANQWQGPPPSRLQPKTNLAPSAKRVPLSTKQIHSPDQTDSNRIQNQTLVPIGRSASSKGKSQNNLNRDSMFSSAGYRKQNTSNKFNQPDSVIQNDLSAAAMPESSNTQIISTHRFQLNYDIAAIDPSGVGQIDLWMTRDRGQSWKLWGQDPDSVSPFPVEVTEEGIYGFRIVVRSVDGLAGRGPSRGDTADMWVLVDSSSPMVKITSVPYGRAREAGMLIVNYIANDANLALRPIRLQWSTNPDGPWTTIEENLRNDGRFAWKPARNTPERIFLRLEAVDRAGNTGVHELSQAIDISGLVPRGTIFGVVPVGE
jgi:hypothetical protein